MQDDIHMRYLQQYYNEHGSIADVEPNGCEFVVFEGKKLYIAKFLSRMREEHKRYIDPSKRKVVSAQTLTRFNRLEKMNFAWEKPRKKRSQTVLDEKPIKYLKYRYSLNKTINDIGYDDVVIFEEQELRIGEYLTRVRAKHREFLKDPNRGEGTSLLSQEKYRILEGMKFEWGRQAKTKAILANENEDPYIDFLQEHFEIYGTINNITEQTVVEVNGQKLQIGAFLQRIRARYRKDVQTNFENIPGLRQIRYQILEDMQFDWNPKEKLRNYQVEQDKYLCFLKEYYQEHGTINDIPIDMVVDYNGETLKIGYFLISIKSLYCAYSKGIRRSGSFSERSLARYQALIEMGYINTNPTKEEQKDIYIEYLKKHYEEHDTINDISYRTEVEFEGQKLQIGRFLAKTKFMYKQYTSGNDDKRAACKLMLQRYEALSELGFSWDLEKKRSTRNLTNSARENGLSISTVRSYYKKFNGDLEKAIKIALLNKKNSIQEQDYNIETILKEFDIDFESLINYLNRDVLRTGNQPSEILRYEGISLREFCLRNNLNYQVIYLAVKLKMDNLCDENLESLINRSIIEYNTKGQKRPATWIYSKYGNEILVKHLLLYIGLDSAQILRDMSRKGLSLYEAVEKASFPNNKDFNYLYGVYHQFVEFYRSVNASVEYTPETAPKALIDYAQEMIEDYHLSREEFQTINNSFKQYTAAIHNYRLFDVAFEKDPVKKVDKIIAYDLDDDDIEEAFFLPLKFNDKVLIGRDSALYQRRTLLKNLTVSWNDLGAEERTKKISNYNLISEEVQYITLTRATIDQTKEKVYTKK